MQYALTAFALILIISSASSFMLVPSTSLCRYAWDILAVDMASSALACANSELVMLAFEYALVEFNPFQRFISTL